MCTAAALAGHFEVLKFLHQNGCPWNKETCEYAAFELHLEVLKYAHTHGCPWDDETCEAACSGGHLKGEQVALDRLEVLKYLRDNGLGKPNV